MTNFECYYLNLKIIFYQKSIKCPISLELHAANIWQDEMLCFLFSNLNFSVKVPLYLRSQTKWRLFRSLDSSHFPSNFKLCFTVHCIFCLHAVCEVTSSSSIFLFRKRHGMDFVAVSAVFTFQTERIVEQLKDDGANKCLSSCLSLPSTHFYIIAM